MNVQQVRIQMATGTVRRDAAQSKETILEAAAKLFSEQGFRATTLQQVASAAEVARGTPHYFFKSKEGLFQAVLERESQAGLAVVGEAKALINTATSKVDVLSSVIDLYWQFLLDNSRFLKLLQWTALEQPYAMDKVQEHWNTILGAAELVRFILPEGVPEETVKQLTLSILGTCTFSFFFGQMAAQPLKLNPQSPSFLKQRSEHIKKQLITILASYLKEES